MIVSNTTPISNLLHIDEILVLNRLFGAVHIPEAVADELNVVFSSYEQWQECLEREQIIIQSVSNTIFVKQLMPFLHRGEAEAICLSLEKKTKLCLIDDKDARAIAQMHDLSVTGTLGILLKAKKTGLISTVKQLIDKLRSEHHFWIREDMYQRVLHIAKEKT